MYNLINGKISLALVLSLLLVACSGNPKKPLWLDNPADAYPSAQYLSAVGSATNREAAANRARANLSHIFQVAIKDTGMDFSQATVTSVDGEQQIENELRTSRFVSADARQVLEGTEIVEYWLDDSGQVYSLAVLKKASANRRFRDAVNRADSKTVDLVDYASQSAPNPVAALRALESARLSQLERDNVNRNLIVTAGRGVTAPYSSEKLDSMIRLALASLEFSLANEGGDIDSEVQSAMAGLGIQENQRSAYRLFSKLDTAPAKKQQGWYWLRGAVELRLESDGETIAKQRWPLKVSALSEGMVEQRAKDTLNNNFSRYLYQMLTAVESN